MLFRRLLQLVIVFFIFSILVDLNEESIFVAGAFLTWFFLFEAIASAVQGAVTKEVTEEYVLLTSLLFNLRDAYKRIRGVIEVMGNNGSFIATLLINLYNAQLRMTVVDVVSYTESKVYALLWNTTTADFGGFIALLSKLNFVTNNLMRTDKSGSALLFC